MIPLPPFAQIREQHFPGEQKNDDWDPSQIFGFLKRRGLVIAAVASVVMAGVASYTFNQTPKYQSSFLLLVEPLTEDDEWKKITSEIGNNLPKGGLDYDSQIIVLRSPERLNSVVKKLKVKYPNISYYSLLNNLTISRLGLTKILNISYSHGDPERVKVVLDEISQSYLKYSLQERQTKLRQGVQFVEKQLPPLKNRVDRLQKQVQIFRQKYNFFNPEAETQQASQQISELIRQRQQIDAELAILRANLASVQQNPGQLAALNEATLYQNLLTQVRELDAQIAIESGRFQDANPVIQSMKDKRQRLLPLLQNEAERIIGVQLAAIVTKIQLLEVRSQELAKVEQQLQQRVQQIPLLERRYIELQRNLKFAADSLDRFLTSRETLQIEIAQTELPWQVIQPASKPVLPYSPNIPRNLLTGLVASAFLGVGAGFLLEKMDNTYHSSDQLKDKLKLPLLGTIPVENQLEKTKEQPRKKKRLKKRVQEELSGDDRMLSDFKLSNAKPIETTNNVESSKFWEAFRMLFNNIKMLSSDKQINSIVISSALPGDGKSTISFYLAQTAASIGLKVLLVDTDMRRANTHKLANLNNLWGLSSLISGDLSMEQAIRELPTMSQVSVITAGHRPPDPIKLLSSDKMKGLMEEFQANYDLVIYDAPPLVGLADASIVAPNADGIILVTRINKTDKSTLTKALDDLKMSQINVLGIVANGDKSKYSAYYKYYYY